MMSTSSSVRAVHCIGACAVALALASGVLHAAEFKVLQPLGNEPMAVKKGMLPHGGYYVPSTPNTVRWGSLPGPDAKAVLTVPSGSTVTIDTVSHEGVLEDQGKDPVKFFGKYGIKPDQVLKDAQAIAASSVPHDFAKDGPHVVTGPVAVEGAKAGDVLKIEIIALQPRVPYGVISNRHGKGALPGEFPETPKPEADASATQPDKYHNVFRFTPIREIAGKWYGIVRSDNGKEARIPLHPFNGTMGVAIKKTEKSSSVPPGEYGGNLDLNEMTTGVGAVLYLPIQVDGGMFYAADPHFVQGDGEVALTALEGSLRSTFRLTVLKQNDPALPMPSPMKSPYAETRDYLIPIGLNEDLDEAMKEAVRQAVAVLQHRYGMDRATALAYLSAGSDFQVTQVVDKVKGVNGMIRKADFVGGASAKTAKAAKKK